MTRLRGGKPSSLPDLATLGVTYRQLDYWTRQGYLTASAEHSGSGYRRSWSPEQLALAERLGRLTRLGMTLDLAYRVATGTSDVGEGVTITLERSDA